ncbi:4Fe-4S dicluster domain-containing protein (plasmid) [Desulfobaculum bizertense]|uniref:4Fe-4S dicluster domain-containing protein n=1 Tax=Desulfobaculum bizertense TaxID=376490 RepID=UPI001F359C30|nr:4Fe-4S dicluster domain-containing protein [Desulfobaculum bizertense]UIJ39519.1 4Fe-4S dicluster domain-containing protein [Desulfobaculum bizertense]
MSVSLNNFVIADSSKCIGCRLCEVACADAHADTHASTVGMIETPVQPRLYMVKNDKVASPVQCRHCEDAPCANVCPVDAIQIVDGSVIVNEDVCMGCKTCMVACPFGAMELMPVFKKGEPVMQRTLKSNDGEKTVPCQSYVARKCDMCRGTGHGPACVDVCPREALQIVRPVDLRARRNYEAALSMLSAIRYLPA